ncbi:MAG: hypothetical protein FWH01_17915, partial [Oscillospiraceae bacterium]|nr:hypothetical protein [Oscillospiraceae bacterium]
MLLALAFIVSGVPQPIWLAMGALLPGAGQFGGGGEAYAGTPSVPPGQIDLDKEAEWATFPGETDPIAKVTLSVKGEPLKASSDVIILLDLATGMYTPRCINPAHYLDQPPIIDRTVNYYVRTAAFGWQPVTDNLRITLTTHKAVSKITGLPEITFAGLHVSGYREEHNGGPVLGYSTDQSGSNPWTIDDWASIETGSGARWYAQTFVRDAIGDTNYILINHPYLFGFLPQSGINRPLIDTTKYVDCQNPVEAGVEVATEFAKTLIEDDDVPNNVAMISFSAGLDNGKHLSVLADYGDDEQHWDDIDMDPNFYAGTEYPTYNYALAAAKYRLIKGGGYSLHDPVSGQDVTSQLIDAPVDSVAFHNAITSNASMRYLLNECQLRGVAGNNSDPYIVIISSKVNIANIGSTESMGLHVDTSGMVIHTVGFINTRGIVDTANLNLISDGYAAAINGDPRPGVTYLGHYD